MVLSVLAPLKHLNRRIEAIHSGHLRVLYITSTAYHGFNIVVPNCATLCPLFWR